MNSFLELHIPDSVFDFSCANVLRNELAKRQLDRVLHLDTDADVYEGVDQLIYDFPLDAQAVSLLCRDCGITCDLITADTGKIVDISIGEQPVCVRGVVLEPAPTIL